MRPGVRSRALSADQKGRRRPGLGLNCIAGFLYLFAQELVYLGLAYWLVRLPAGRLSLLAISDHGRVPRALGLAFVWLAARDFFYYWLHRMQHASKWLWAEYALHHADEHVNVTTTIRQHWLDGVLTVFFVNVPPLLLLRPPLITLPVMAWLVSLPNLTTHMNFRFGPRTTNRDRENTPRPAWPQERG